MEREFASRKRDPVDGGHAAYVYGMHTDHETISAWPVPNAVPGAPKPRQSAIASETGQSSADDPDNEIAP